MKHAFTNWALTGLAVTLIIIGQAPGAVGQARDVDRNAAIEPTSDQPAPGSGRRWAIIISVDEYQDDRIADLRYCNADGRLMKQVLSEECGYDPRDVVMLSSGGVGQSSQPLLDNMRDELRFALRKAHSDDVVLIFFSGHGYLNNSGAGFLLPADCDPADIEGTSLATSDLRKWMADCGAAHKLLVLDCCHAGGKAAAVGPTGEELGGVFLQTPGLLTIASCRAGEKSREWERRQHGLFTYFFAQGLRGEADHANDGFVDSTELFGYVRTQVLATAEELKTKQTPVQVVRGGEVPVFVLAKVTPKVFFEDFSGADPGLLPDGWLGKGLSVQDVGAQQLALQNREIGTGSVQLPVQKISKDFYAECFFATNGYVNKPRELELVLHQKQGTPVLQVRVLDRYPSCYVTVNGRQIHTQLLKYKGPNHLYIVRKGRSLQVKLNDETVQALAIDQIDLPTVQISLGNSRDEYGRADTSRFPTVYSIRIGPLLDSDS